MSRQAASSRGRLALALTSGLLVAVLAGCGGGSDGPVTPLGGGTSGTATGSPTTSSAPTTTSAGQLAVLAANATLGKALASMASASTAVTAETRTLRPVRSQVSSALSSARGALKAVRASAYGSSRSCSSILANASAARTYSARTSSAAARVHPIAGKLNADVSHLETTISTVKKDLAALQAAAKGVVDPPTTVTTSEVDAALKAATDLASSGRSTASSANSNASSSSGSAAKAASSATTVADKVC